METSRSKEKKSCQTLGKKEMQTNLQVQWGPKRKIADTVLLRNWKREREREWKTVGLKGCEDFCDEGGGGEFKMERKSARKEMFVNGINERKFWERYQWEGNLGHSICIGPPDMIQIWKYLGCNFLHESHNPLVFQKNILRIYVYLYFQKRRINYGVIYF